MQPTIKGDFVGRVENKVALITGGATGMGLSHARLLLDEGANVVIADIDDARGESAMAELGSHSDFVHLDVANPDNWHSAVEHTIGRWGALDVLVNNAGISTVVSIENMTIEQWNTIIAVNLTSVFLGMKAALPALKLSSAASVINISSTAGMQGYVNAAGYNASKFGVRGLTKSAALELGPFGIRVNSVHPGTITTTMANGVNPDRSHVALGRFGDPDEVSRLVLFLASDESSFSTGAEFIVDGGELAGRARRGHS
jgi:3alpha(or 20beta)-hydroxysteroid dehydrogenase